MTALDPAARPDAATVAHELRSSAPTAVLAGLAAPVASPPPIAAAAHGAPPAAGGAAAAPGVPPAPRCRPAPAPAPTPAPVGGRRRFPPAVLIGAAWFLASAVPLGAFILTPDGTGGPAGPAQTA